MILVDMSAPVDEGERLRIPSANLLTLGQEEYIALISIASTELSGIGAYYGHGSLSPFTIQLSSTPLYFRR